MCHFAGKDVLVLKGLALTQYGEACLVVAVLLIDLKPPASPAEAGWFI